jgi:glc operon protein GlcG
MGRKIGTKGRRPGAARAILALAVGWAGWMGAGALATAQEPAPAAGRAIGEIRDRAGLFGADAIASARGELERVARETGASVIVETVDTTGGEPVERYAIGQARHSGIRGIFVLIARKEHKLEVLGSGHYRELLSDTHRREIIGAFSEGFRRQDPNEGLRRGVAELARVMQSARHNPSNVPRAPVPEAASGLSSGMAAMAFGQRTGADSPLVAHNQVRLTLAGARAIIAGAEAKAQASGWKMNIAVVDDGGHLIAFERMEGARPASVYTALTKATTAATMRQPSGPFPPGTTSPDPLLNISLQNAAMASGGKVTTLYGGVPVVVDGQVIGGVGVGGGSGEQDAQVARAGIQALTDLLARPAVGAGEEGTRRGGSAGPQGIGSNQGKTPNPGSATRREDPDF